MNIMMEEEFQIKKIVDSFIGSFPTDPLAPNYHNARKLKAAHCLLEKKETDVAFHLSEATAAGLRTMAAYRQEQLALNIGDKMQHITNYLQPIENIINSETLSLEEKEIYPFLNDDAPDIKITQRKSCEKQAEPLHRKYLRFSGDNTVDNFLKVLEEFPDEWTVVQITAPYNPNESVKPRSVHRAEMDAVYISLLRNDYTDAAGSGPLTVNVSANVHKQGELPLFVELYSLLDANVETMENASRTYTQKTVHKYWEKRQDIDLRMASVIKVMDKEWLGGWKCLLTGKLKDKEFRDKVRELVDRTCEDWGFIRFTVKQKILLCNLLESCHHISSAEIRWTLQKILTTFPSNEEIASVMENPQFNGCEKCRLNLKQHAEMCTKCAAAIFQATHHFSLVDGIKAFMEGARQVMNEPDWESLKSAKRYPVIIIVDEMLDTFPWESLPILSGQPVTRMENVHLLYSMFKSHEDSMVNGYFVVKRRPVLGRYVINPANNLDRMGKRMSSFMEYWCPSWEGDTDKPPEPHAFLDYLTTSDIFVYCGHGDGCQYACGAGSRCGVESVAGSVRAAALLSGCGSVRLQQSGGRVPPLGSHYHYHIAGSPMVVGMLWEVTDLEVDKVVTTLLALAVPSAAPVPWQAVGKAQWSLGTLDVNVESKPVKSGTEQDFLRAIAKARRASNFLMIASSMVARGLPVLFVAQDTENRC